MSSEKIRREFQLHPFDATGAPPVALAGSLVRYFSLLRLEFRLTGDLCRIVIPSRAAQSLRRNKLWEATCFELFFAAPDASAYYEINFSPAGHWNLYRFDSYRQGMQEVAIECLKYRILSDPEALIIRIEIDLASLDLQKAALKASPCAVLLSATGTPSYWAIAHSGPQPDFHDQRPWSLTFFA